MYGDPFWDDPGSFFYIVVLSSVDLCSSIDGRSFHHPTLSGWIHSKVGMETEYEFSSVANRTALWNGLIAGDRHIV